MIPNRSEYAGENHYEESFSFYHPYRQRGGALNNIRFDDCYENDIHLSNEPCQGCPLKAGPENQSSVPRWNIFFPAPLEIWKKE